MWGIRIRVTFLMINNGATANTQVPGAVVVSASGCGSSRGEESNTIYQCYSVTDEELDIVEKPMIRSISPLASGLPICIELTQPLITTEAAIE